MTLRARKPSVVGKRTPPAMWESRKPSVVGKRTPPRPSRPQVGVGAGVGVVGVLGGADVGGADFAGGVGVGVGLGATATTTEIVSPRASIDPESGSCDVTRPGGCSSVSSSVKRTLKPADFASASARSRFTPTRFGTVDSPVAYVSVTFADNATVEPSLGLTDST